MQGQRLGARSFRRTWLALLNLIFAITTSGSSHGSAPSQTRADEAELYYHRAIALCTAFVLKRTSHEIGVASKIPLRGYSTDFAVQLLVLAETYLQGSQRSVQTWTFHGLTVDAAFQAGLHSKQTLEVLPLHEQEARKRTWYCCVMNDWSVSYNPSLVVCLLT